jgi:hypothetical protein
VRASDVRQIHFTSCDCSFLYIYYPLFSFPFVRLLPSSSKSEKILPVHQMHAFLCTQALLKSGEVNTIIVEYACKYSNDGNGLHRCGKMHAFSDLCSSFIALSCVSALTCVNVHEHVLCCIIDFICMCVRMFVCMYVCMFVCMYVCMYVCMQIH